LDYQPVIEEKKKKRRSRDSSISSHRNGEDRKRSCGVRMIVSVSQEIVNGDSLLASAHDSSSCKVPFKKKNIQEHYKERKALKKKLQYACGKSVRAQDAVIQLSHQVNIIQAKKIIFYQGIRKPSRHYLNMKMLHQRQETP